MANINTIRENGANLIIHYDDGSRVLALYTGSGTWFVGAATTPDPDPPGDGFRWPFNPDDIGTEWEGYLGHKGVDWPKPDGTPILAAQAGVVEMSGWTGTQGDWASGWGWGNKVVINHGAIGAGGDVLRTLYAHMNATPLVSVNDTVTKGQVIGYVGTTGDSTGNHLHWETSVNGMYNQINPRDFMAQYGE